MAIDARPRNVQYQEGTGPRTGLLARRVDPGMGGGLDVLRLSNIYKDLPMSMINREANIRRGQGMMYNPRTGTFQRDSMYNRSGFGFGREPVGGMQQPQAPAMTEPQQQWARLAQEKQSGAGALGKIGEKMANMNVNPMFGAGLQAVGAAVNAATNPSFAINPYAGTREQNIANAKAAGMFDKVRADYNRKNEAAGYEMDADGNITRNPAIVAKDISEGRQMASDFNRGVERTKSGNTFSSPYGRGRSKFGVFGPGKPQSMVKDDFGNWVPMSPYLRSRQIIQASKGMI